MHIPLCPLPLRGMPRGEQRREVDYKGPNTTMKRTITLKVQRCDQLFKLLFTLAMS